MSNSRTATEQQIMAAIQQGLPLTPRPYLDIARQLGIEEWQVIDIIDRFQQQKLIKRFGLVVNHHSIGYTSNAMVVWDVADHDVDQIGESIKNSGLVTLCYRRPRRLPRWRYNLFCMIHGLSRDEVYSTLNSLIQQCGLTDTHHQVLFSTRQFKQCGGRYAASTNNESNSHDAIAATAN